MLIHRSLFAIACRAVSLSLLVVGTSPLTRAQTPQPIDSHAEEPLLLASTSAPIELATESSSSNAPASSPDLFDSRTIRLAASQPTPRRYGRRNYSDKNSNPDGSPRYTILAGVGVAIPIGNTHTYQTPSYKIQIGGGRNFNQNLGIMLQFDYDHFGLQATTLANQQYIYNYCTPAQAALGCTASISGLNGNNHVWSITLNPTFTLATTGSLGAYAVVGGGFYHKVTNFTLPQTAEQCGLYGCGYYTVQANVDHYTSNAAGVNGGFGLTYKFSQFSNERFYIEGRYVFIANQMRTGSPPRTSPPRQPTRPTSTPPIATAPHTSPSPWESASKPAN